MTKKGGVSKHLKRLPAPKGWPISRKMFKWVVKPSPGPHSLNRSLPLLIVLREVLGLAKNRREAQMMLADGHVKVDGRVRRKDTYPVGLMDVIEIPAVEKAYRVLPSRRGLSLHTLDGNEKTFKLCKIVSKTILRGGHVQLHTHDGKNIMVKITNPEHPVEDVYSTHDVLKVEIPRLEILAHLKFEEGILGIVESGKNSGVLVEVIKIVKREWPSTFSLSLRDLEGKQFETIFDYIFPLGKGETWITLPKDKFV